MVNWNGDVELDECIRCRVGGFEVIERGLNVHSVSPFNVQVAYELLVPIGESCFVTFQSHSLCSLTHSLSRLSFHCFL